MADGHTLFFQSARPGGEGSFSIWQSTRQSLSEPFRTPVVVTATNSPAADFSPGISADGLTLYFGSLRSGGQGNYDLWQATRPTTVDQFVNPTNLGSTANSSANDGQPTITADGLTLYFGSKRSGGIGSRSIWSTTRTTVNDPFGVPVNLGPVVNSDAADSPGSVSHDGKTLYLSSDREGGLGASDIWVAPIEQPSVQLTGYGQTYTEDFNAILGIGNFSAGRRLPTGWSTNNSGTINSQTTHGFPPPTVHSERTTSATASIELWQLATMIVQVKTNYSFRPR